MRLAFYSPLNPVASGISDYSEELLPLLAREFEIDLIVDDYQPGNPALAAFPIRRREALLQEPGRYDLVLYQMGNSPAHDHIYRTLLKLPGVVVLHDLVLHHLRAWQTVDRRDEQGYVRAMRADYGEAGAELARLEARGLAALNRFDFPLSGDVARSARALIVHSEFAARVLEQIAPQTPVAVVPMGVPPPTATSREQARARLGFGNHAFVAAAFGEIHPNKRVTVALQAFAEFRARRPDSLFVLVGRESPGYDVMPIIRRLGLEDSVRCSGFVPRAAYDDYVAAADLCLNLRYPTAGESSASLLRLFAAGKPVIVTRTGAYAELPDAVCAKIAADEYEQELLRESLFLFARRPDLRAMLGENARAFAARCHTLEQSAAGYADFLRAVQAGRASSRSYLAPWSAGGAGGGRTTGDEGKDTEAGERKTDDGEMVPRGAEAVAFQPQSLLDSIAFDYADLGLAADDPVLASVAQALAELGLTGDASPPS